MKSISNYYTLLSNIILSGETVTVAVPDKLEASILSMRLVTV